MLVHHGGQQFNVRPDCIPCYLAGNRGPLTSKRKVRTIAGNPIETTVIAQQLSVHLNRITGGVIQEGDPLIEFGFEHTYL